MRIKPFAHRVLVKPVVAIEEDKAFQAAKRMGLELIKGTEAQEQTKIDKGHVVAIGPTAFKDFNTDVPFKVGDLVIYAKYAGKAVKDGDTEYLILNDEDLCGVCMIEEVKTEEVVEDKQEAPAPTAMEQKALDMGWRPRSEFHGDEEDFIDAKEFVNRKPLFDKIESLKGAVTNNQQTVKALLEHNAKVEKAAYERALKTLRAEQKQAIEAGDMSRYHELQEEIDETKSAPPTVPEALSPTPVPAEVTNWIARNSWYARDARMKAAADAIGLEGNGNGLRGQPLLDYIEKEVRKEFPHKFVNPNQARAASVEGKGSGNAAGGRGRSDDDYALNEQEKRIMNTLVASKTMSKQEYIKQLKQAKGEE